jgi:UDPglucose--hexose-1-phosphate uridylyltransferase
MCSAAIMEELSILLQQQVTKLESVLDEPAYNVLFHLPPYAEMETEPWYVEIFPRLTTAAGFELGTDIWVNPVAPEMAARRLR